MAKWQTAWFGALCVPALGAAALTTDINGRKWAIVIGVWLLVGGSYSNQCRGRPAFHVMPSSGCGTTSKSS